MDSDLAQLTLPVTGMTCANCVSTVERNLRRVDGVDAVSVNLATERASISYDPARTDGRALVERVRRAGYDVALGEAVFALRRLGDDSDARRLEKAIAAIGGVQEVRVNLTAESLSVRYIPTVVSQVELRRAVGAAGFEVLEGEEASKTSSSLRARTNLPGSGICLSSAWR